MRPLGIGFALGAAACLVLAVAVNPAMALFAIAYGAIALDFLRAPC